MQKLKVYLDNCCYNRPYDDQSQIKIALETEAKLFVQQLVIDNKIDLVWSFMVTFENNNNPYIEQKTEIATWRDNATENIESNAIIHQIANEIAATGVKSTDSVHVACAIFSKCDYFLTTDKRITKYVTDKTKILTPIEFLDEWSDTDE